MVADAGSGSDPDGPVVGESRLPMAVAVVVLMIAAIVAPRQLAIMPGWVLATVEGLLLVALIVQDPGRIDRTGPWPRRTSIALVIVILASTLGSTALLIYDLVIGSPLTAQADELLIAGAKVWLGNNVAFAFLYWQFDGGGPAVRAHGLPRFPDFAFPQQLNPDLAPPRWRPQLVRRGGAGGRRRCAPHHRRRARGHPGDRRSATGHPGRRRPGRARLRGAGRRARGRCRTAPRRDGAGVQGDRRAVLRRRPAQGGVRHRDPRRRRQHAGADRGDREADQVHR